MLNAELYFTNSKQKLHLLWHCHYKDKLYLLNNQNYEIKKWAAETSIKFELHNNLMSALHNQLPTVVSTSPWSSLLEEMKACFSPKSQTNLVTVFSELSLYRFGIWLRYLRRDVSVKISFWMQILQTPCDVPSERDPQLPGKVILNPLLGHLLNELIKTSAFNVLKSRPNIVSTHGLASRNYVLLYKKSLFELWLDHPS